MEDSWEELLNDIKNDEIEVNNNAEVFMNNSHREIDMSFGNNDSTEIKKKVSACECGGKLFAKRNYLICQDCGLESQNSSNSNEEQYSISANTECNVNDNGFMALSIVGKGSYGLQRSLYMTCATYKKYSKGATLRVMFEWNTHCKEYHIPKNVIIEANEMFAKIKESGYVYRKDGKKGVLSACLYYACYNNGITKTPREIAQFSGIEEKFHSQGDRILHDLNEKGVITIPTRVNPIDDYVSRYMDLLQIPKKYKDFVVELIERAERHKLHLIHDSQHNTKCVGALYMLIERVPELRVRINKDMIEEKCGMSKTTFTRYYDVLCRFYRKIKKTFKKHHIPMKLEWRDD